MFTPGENTIKRLTIDDAKTLNIEGNPNVRTSSIEYPAPIKINLSSNEHRHS